MKILPGWQSNPPKPEPSHHKRKRSKRDQSKKLRGLKGWNQSASLSPAKIIMRAGQILDRKRFMDIYNPAPDAESHVMASQASRSRGRLLNSVPQQAEPVNDGSRRADQDNSVADPAPF